MIILIVRKYNLDKYVLYNISICIQQKTTADAVVFCFIALRFT